MTKVTTTWWQGNQAKVQYELRERDVCVCKIVSIDGQRWKHWQHWQKIVWHSALTKCLLDKADKNDKDAGVHDQLSRQVEEQLHLVRGSMRPRQDHQHFQHFLHLFHNMACTLPPATSVAQWCLAMIGCSKSAQQSLRPQALTPQHTTLPGRLGCHRRATQLT